MQARQIADLSGAVVGRRASAMGDTLTCYSKTRIGPHASAMATAPRSGHRDQAPTAVGHYPRPHWSRGVL